MPTVLVVEDDTAISDLITECLVVEGYTVRRGCGDAALSSARNDPPALIVLDLLMPGETGAYQTAGEHILATIRGDPALAGLPVIVLTAWPEKAQQARGLGANVVILKPSLITELSSAVRAAIGPPEPQEE